MSWYGNDNLLWRSIKDEIQLTLAILNKCIMRYVKNGIKTASGYHHKQDFIELEVYLIHNGKRGSSCENSRKAVRPYFLLLVLS